jgi:hypothetical protein
MNVRDHIEQFPHCDPRVLHAPEDNCIYCNAHPEWQALRIAWGIAFTGHSFDNQGNPMPDANGGVILPCPAQYNRGMTSVNGWHGNVPVTPEEDKRREEAFERVSKEFEENGW